MPDTTDLKPVSPESALASAIIAAAFTELTDHLRGSITPEAEQDIERTGEYLMRRLGAAALHNPLPARPSNDSAAMEAYWGGPERADRQLSWEYPAAKCDWTPILEDDVRALRRARRDARLDPCHILRMV